jgi:hypothetical protein
MHDVLERVLEILDDHAVCDVFPEQKEWANSNTLRTFFAKMDKDICTTTPASNHFEYIKVLHSDGEFIISATQAITILNKLRTQEKHPRPEERANAALLINEPES